MLRIINVIAALILITEGIELGAGLNNEQWKEFEEFQTWKEEKQHHEYERKECATQARAAKFDDGHENGWKNLLDPPSVDEIALMARYVVNQADWTSLSTISTRKDIETFPVANVIALSDGLIGSGSGIPYVYLTPLDFTAKDLAMDNRASLLVTLAEGNYCKEKQLDPMDPRCARVIISGKIKAVSNESAEYQFAKQAVFGRHPHMMNMPADHGFFIAKLKMSAIALFDKFGGPKYIGIKDYFNAPVNNIAEELQQFLMKRASQGNFDTALKLPIYNTLRV